MNHRPNGKPDIQSHQHEKQTEGVKTLMGDPKKAIIKLAWPMIVAMSVNTIYNLVDAIWVSGLGADALAAVGFFFPFFFMAMAIAAGVGTGGGAAISRRIGSKDKAGADNVAVHTIILMLIATVSFTLPFFIFAENIFINIGAGKITGLVVSYARVMFGGTLIIFFTFVANFILRAEGDATRAMYAMMLGAGLNIVLDPFFIFGPDHPGPWIFGQVGLDLGVAGAAWATIISFSITGIIMLNWLFFKKDTYVSFNFHDFKFNNKILKDISKVGLPASVMHLSMSFTMLIMNVIIVIIASTDGVAVYTTGWRVVTIAILPQIGIATAVTSVTGAAYGARNIEKLKIAFFYSIKLGLGIAILVAIVTFLLAPQITAVFTQAEEAAHIADDLILFLQIICLFYPGVAFGMFSSAMFQGTGKGMNALAVTIFRTILLAPPLGLLFAFYFNIQLPGVWIGLVTANLIGSTVAFLWARSYINGLKITFERESDKSSE
jgi:putative MATE family efflux protein